MKTLGERVRAYRKKRRMSQAELGRALGLSSQRISQVESGGTLSYDQIRIAAKALGIDPAALFDINYQLPTDEPNARVVATPRTAAFIPILGTVAGGATGVFLTNGENFGQVEVPSVVSKVKGAYAVIVDGDSMEGHLTAGDTVYVDPHRPPRAGDTVVVQLAPEKEGGDWSYFVKKFVRRNETEIVLRQLNPTKEISHKAERIAAVHTAVGVIFR